MSTSHKIAWPVGSYNTTSSDCLSRPRNDSFFLFLPNSGWPHHPLTGVSVFPPAVAGDTLTPSRSPYWPGVPVTLLLWVLTAESSKLAPFSETRLTGADRTATANTDGYETLTLFVKEGTIVWWGLWSRAFPLYQAKAVHDLSHILSWFLLFVYPDLLSPSQALLSEHTFRRITCLSPKSLSQAVISWWSKLRKLHN